MTKGEGIASGHKPHSPVENGAVAVRGYLPSHGSPWKPVQKELNHSGERPLVSVFLQATMVPKVNS